MKTIILLVLVAAALAAEEKYTTRYDNIDLDEILTKPRLFNNYYNCLMDKGRCTPDARELKKILPDALKTECGKCSETQKKGTEKVLRHLIENKPSEWKALSAKYDPTGIYQTKYEGEAEKRGIDVAKIKADLAKA